MACVTYHVSFTEIRYITFRNIFALELDYLLLISENYVIGGLYGIFQLSPSENGYI